jgi:hypothetical protein
MGLICKARSLASRRTAQPTCIVEPYLEVQRNKRENQGFQVLYKVIKHSKTLRIRRFSDIHKGANFRGLRGKRG